MGQHFKMRTYQRVPLCGHGYYLSEDFLGKAIVWDISARGWRLQGDHQVSIGMKLTLRLDLSGNVPPVEVEKATVQWVRGRDFGVRIEKISSQAAKRLGHLIGVCRRESYAVRH